MDVALIAATARRGPYKLTETNLGPHAVTFTRASRAFDATQTKENLALASENFINNSATSWGINSGSVTFNGASMRLATDGSTSNSAYTNNGGFTSGRTYTFRIRAATVSGTASLRVRAGFGGSAQVDFTAAQLTPANGASYVEVTGTIIASGAAFVIEALAGSGAGSFDVFLVHVEGGASALTANYVKTTGEALWRYHQPSNVPRSRRIGEFTAFLLEPSRTNRFLNSTAPATQTITLTATGSYTLSVEGTGNAAIAAGTATITGAGTATSASSVTINCTATGTVTVTVTGSPTHVQLEDGTFATSRIQTSGTAATRAADTLSIASTVGDANARTWIAFFNPSGLVAATQRLTFRAWPSNAEGVYINSVGTITAEFNTSDNATLGSLTNGNVVAGQWQHFALKLSNSGVTTRRNKASQSNAAGRVYGSASSFTIGGASASGERYTGWLILLETPRELSDAEIDAVCGRGRAALVAAGETVEGGWVA